MLLRYRLFALPIHWFLALFRLNKNAVCYMSRVGDRDYHDYPDDPEGVDGLPCHFVRYTCERCGKQFTI